MIPNQTTNNGWTERTYVPVRCRHATTSDEIVTFPKTGTHSRRKQKTLARVKWHCVDGRGINETTSVASLLGRGKEKVDVFVLAIVI